ncbi:hypothetical protein GP486_003361 [Trichoglossum hirsutum]|uniref:Ankyrin repeat protein n=1 Tax=Trichoglossum hirsutum TaxID=265104 RepID=A0A9P8LDA6_9PEZI|nr:hypothetical protein GP486_003361 [Trichoglossum hirsutum]
MASGLPTSSIASLSGRLLTKCYNYGCAAADAPAEVKLLIGEITSLTGILVAMQAHEGGKDNVLSELSPGEIPGEGRMDSLGGPMEQCRQTLQEIHDILDRAKMDSERSSIATATQADVHSIRVELENSRMERRSEEMVQQRRQIYKWLARIDFEMVHATASALHYPGTGTWLLESEEMSTWVEANNAFLWIQGIPILNRIVLPSKSAQDVVAYFYCDFREKDAQRPEAVLGSIICQICRQFDDIPSVVEMAFNSHSNSDGLTTPPSYKELERTLTALLRLCHHATIVIDALDECHHRSDLLNLLADVTTLDPRNVRVLVTSRREMDIVKAFGTLPQISLTVEAVDSDIRRYLSNIVDAKASFAAMNASLKASIVSSLTEGASGMFRWARCQIDDISRLRTNKAIRQALGSLPRDLDETYERILLRIPEYDQTLAKRALMWLAFSLRPMRLCELAEAVVVEVGNFKLDPEERLRDQEDVLAICGSLVTYIKKTDEVILAHHSVKEFLLSERARLSVPIYHLPSSIAETQIAKSCLTYVLQDSFGSGPCLNDPDMEARLHKYPLLIYAAKFWALHVGLRAPDSELMNLALTLLSPSPTPTFMAWVQIICLFSGPGGWYNFPKNATPLYYASSYGLLELVNRLLTEGVDIDGMGGMYRGTALHAAVWRNHPEIVETLLRRGADTRILDINMDTAEDLAYMTGNQTIIELLVENDGIGGRDPIF